MKQKILDFVHGNGPSDTPLDELLRDTDLSLIPLIAEMGQDDLPIEPLERLEEVLKHVLSRAMAGQIQGHDARAVANSMKQLGLMLKYKPYAVKASSPLGYSVFLQRVSEGFSFQNHLEHKTEVFHILEVLEGGFVFLCHYEDWQQHYEPESFTAWLNGASHPFFDKCRFYPQPGDVFVISELGIVHTVIGCILEEFATASTDMVQRLHDQNDRNAIPDFPREQTTNRLKQLAIPPSARKVDMLSGDEITFQDLPVETHSFGEQVTLTDTFVKASHVRVNPQSSMPPQTDAQRAIFLRVFEGRGELELRDPAEAQNNANVTPVSVAAGDTVMIAPNLQVTIRNPSDTRLEFSEHRIPPNVAFI